MSEEMRQIFCLDNVSFIVPKEHFLVNHYFQRFRFITTPFFRPEKTKNLRDNCLQIGGEMSKSKAGWRQQNLKLPCLQSSAC